MLLAIGPDKLFGAIGTAIGHYEYLKSRVWLGEKNALHAPNYVGFLVVRKNHDR
jgi:hypothetical protein